MTIVTMPDGTPVRFPDTMSSSQIKDLILKKFPDAERQAQAKTGVKPYQNTLQAVGTALQNAPGEMANAGLGLISAGAQSVNNLVNGTPNLNQIPLPPIISGVVGGPDMSGALSFLPGDVKHKIGEETAKQQLRDELQQIQNNKGQQALDTAPGDWVSPLAAEGIKGAAELAPAMGASLLTRSPAPLIAQGAAQAAGSAYAESQTPQFAAPGTPLVSDATAAQLHGFTPDKVAQIAAKDAAVPQPFKASTPEAGLEAAKQYGVVGGVAADIGAGPLLKEGINVFQRTITEALVNAGVSAGSAVLNSATDLAYTNPDLTVGEIVDRVKTSAEIGGVTGAALGTAAGAMHALPGRRAPSEAASIEPEVPSQAPEAPSQTPESPSSTPAAVVPPQTDSELVHRATEAVKATKQPVTPDTVNTAIQTMDPLGPFQPDQLSPELVQHVDAWRKGNDKTTAAPITMADIAQSNALHPDMGVKGARQAVDNAILTKIPNADRGNYTAGDIFDTAAAKNIAFDANFAKLAERTTGIGDVTRMSPVQLSAMQQVLDGLPAHDAITSLPIADPPPFTRAHADNVKAALAAGEPFTPQLVRDQTGLTSKADVNALRDSLVRDGTLVQDSQNTYRLGDGIPPTVAASPLKTTETIPTIEYKPIDPWKSRNDLPVRRATPDEMNNMIIQARGQLDKMQNILADAAKYSEPDSYISRAYSTLSKVNLKKGETWKGRVEQHVANIQSWLAENEPKLVETTVPLRQTDTSTRLNSVGRPAGEDHQLVHLVTADVVDRPDERHKIVGAFSTPEDATTAADRFSRRDASENAGGMHRVGIHDTEVQGPIDSEGNVYVAASKDEDGVTVLGAYGQEENARAAQDAVLRARWQRFGRKTDDYGDVPDSQWRALVKSWNDAHPTERHSFDDDPDVDPEYQAFVHEQLGADKEGLFTQPYPGAARANAHFAESRPDKALYLSRIKATKSNAAAPKTLSQRSVVPRSQTLKRMAPVETANAPGGTPLNNILNKGLFKPGAKHVASYHDAGYPIRPASDTVRTAGAAKLRLPTEEAPARRKAAVDALRNIIGKRLYIGRVSGGKDVLGNYTPRTGVIAARNFDDIEIVAHEAAHWLDHGNRYKAIFEPLRDKYAAELKPISYTTDPSLDTIEGFAEYVRLWLTNYPAAEKAVPNFTKAFKQALIQTQLWKDMTRAQELAHKFYFQGPEATLAGKIGEASTPEKVAEVMKNLSAKTAWNAAADLGNLEYNRTVNSLHGLAALEIAARGKIGEGANSPYTLAVASRGTEGTTNAIIDNGTATLAENGDLIYDGGKGLKDIFAPVSKKGFRHFNDLMRYFAARRGQELLAQDREHLFTREEIAANLALGQRHPEFARIFDEFQGFNRRMLDFMVKSNALTDEQRNNILERNANWVPFQRVIEHVMNGGDLSDAAVRQLRGSSRNSRDIMQNILQSVTNNVQAARIGQIKARTYKTIMEMGDEGALWAREIDAGSHQVTLAQEQMRDRVAQVLRELGHNTSMGGRVTMARQPISSAVIALDNMQQVFQQFPEMATFWVRNQKPNPNGNFIDQAIIDGRLRYFESQHPLFIDTMTSLAGQRLPVIKGIGGAAVNFLRGVKRTETRLITSMPQFFIRNIIRDTMDAGIQSTSGFRPVVDTLRGMRHDIARTPQQKLAELNGLYFSGQLMANTAEGRAGRVLDGMPTQSVQEAVLKMLNRYDAVVGVGEHSTRLGEYLRAVDQGTSLTEAAARGRTVTVDFAQMGSADWVRNVASVTPFLNSALQGNAQVIKALFTDKNGRMNFGGPGPYLKFATKLLLGWGGLMALGTAALWNRNKDDPRYLSLTPDQKSGAWHFWATDNPNDHGLAVPKPYGAGFVFGDLVENILDYSYKHDGKEAAANLGMAFQTRFGLTDWTQAIPGFVSPLIEGYYNTEWTGAPIVPDRLQHAPNQMQFSDATPLIYNAIAKHTGWSPLMAEHYTRGYLGYAAQMMEDLTQSMLWDKEHWGDMPFPPDPKDLVLHGMTQDHPDYRTRWTEEYYTLRNQALGMSAAFKYAKQNNIRDPNLFKGLSDSQANTALQGLSRRFAVMDKALYGLQKSVAQIKYNPSMSRPDKEKAIETLYQQHNQLLEQDYKAAASVIAANGG